MISRTLYVRTVTLTLLLVLYCCTLSSADSTANNANGTDGVIVWGDLEPDKPYKTVGYEADDGGLDPYYALAVSFIDSSLPEKLPVAKVKGIIDGTENFQDSWKGLAIDFVGFIICLVIGILFIVIFPIVGFCFCCCRLCGNCGGKRRQKQGEHDRCKRIVFASAISVLSLFVIAGAACTFVTSDLFHKNLDEFNSSFSDAIDDFNTFIDNIDSQFTRLGDTNFKFLANVLTNYVNNTSDEVSKNLIKAISSLTNLDKPLDDIKRESQSALASTTTLSTQVSTLRQQRTDTKQKLNARNCNNCHATRITKLDSMDTALDQMQSAIDDFKDKVSTDVFDAMKKDLDTAIADEVRKGTDKLDVASTLDDIHQKQILPLLSKVDDLRAQLNKESSTYQKKVEEIVDIVKPYDQYRWYAGLALACFLLLIAVLMLLGVVLGCLCGSHKVKPTERSSASNCGGIFLMSAVGLIFIFGALLMLLTTLMYVFGSLTERYACQSVDHLDRIEEYTSSFSLGFDLKNVSFEIQGERIRTSISDLMNDCKEGKTLYTVLGLRSIVNKSISEIAKYKTKIGDELNTINASKAAEMANGKVNTDSEISALQDTVTAIGRVKSNITTLKSGLQSQQTAAENDDKGAGAAYDPMIVTLTSMEQTTDSLETSAQNINRTAIELNNTALPDALNRLRNETIMSSLIKSVTDDFIHTIFGFVDSYINDIIDKLSYDVAKCNPFYSITNAIFSETLCHGIVDPLNGFWLAIGWCIFFFMPSLILAVKLTKHFRIMHTEDTYDSSLDRNPMEMKSPMEQSVPPMREPIEIQQERSKAHHQIILQLSIREAAEAGFMTLSQEDHGKTSNRKTSSSSPKSGHNKVAPF